MKKHLVLGALAAVSIAACSSGSNDDAESEESSVRSANWPTLRDERGCFGATVLSKGPYAGHVVRLRFKTNGEQQRVELQFYSKTSGLLADWRGFGLQKNGNKITMTSSSTGSTSNDGTIVRTQALNGTITTKLQATSNQLKGLLGTAEIQVVCDVDPGAPLLKNPAMPAKGSRQPVTSATRFPFPTPKDAACVAADLIPSGRHAGHLMRIEFIKNDDGVAVNAVIRLHDPSTGFQVNSFGVLVEPDATQGYRLYTTSSRGSKLAEGKLVPEIIGGKTILAFTALDGRLAREIGGSVPIQCDFVGP